MNREVEIIKRMLENLPKSEFHLNSFFESDSEVLDIQGKKVLFSVDEFSQEDLFRDHHPYSLGWNLAISTISDILACGGKPTLYAHSMTVSHRSWDNDFINQFSKGIADVLKKCNTGFIGGDVGFSDIWRYTGIAFGEAERPLSRKGAKPGQLIYSSGCIGAGNLEAAIKLNIKNKGLKTLLKHYTLFLRCRIKESELIKQYASACIDSSDGLINVLNTIAEINNVGYEIANIPYLNYGLLACKVLGKPKIVLALGQCGEYELIFTLEKEKEQAFLECAKQQQLTFHKIGEIIKDTHRAIKSKKNYTDISGFQIKARDYDKIEDYLNALVEFAKSIS